MRFRCYGRGAHDRGADYGRGYGREGYGRENERFGGPGYDRWSYGRESYPYRGGGWDQDRGYSGRDDFERGRYFGGGEYGAGREDRGWDRDRGGRDDFVNDRYRWDRNRKW